MNKPLQLFIETRCQYCRYLKKCFGVDSIDEIGVHDYSENSDYHIMILCKLLKTFEMKPN